MNRLISVVVAVGLGFGLSTGAEAAIYTPGNLVVLQFDGGGAALNNRGTLGVLREFGLSGTQLGGGFVANDLALPSLSSDPQKLVFSGTATSEGQLTRSVDGRYLTMFGYNGAIGASGVSGGSIATSGNVTGGSTPQLTRTVGRIGFDQSANYYDVTQSYSNSNVRSAASVDGSSFYTGGTSGTSGSNANTGGVRLLTPPVTTPVAQTGAGTLNNVRVVNFGPSNNVFASSQSTGFFGVSQISGGTATLLPGFAAAFATEDLSSTDFWFRDANTLYIADEGQLTGTVTTGTPPNQVTKNRVGGLQKWTFNGSAWSLAARFTGAGVLDDIGTTDVETALTAGLRSLTGVVDPAGRTVLYATTGETSTRLVAFVDDGSATINTPFYQLAVAGANTAFRGVDFAPIPAPGTIALLGMGGLLAARRRR